MDKTPLYNMKLKKSGIDLIPGMKYEQIEPYLEELYDHMAESNKLNKGIFKKQEWVAGYATIYRRKAVDKIGLFDEKFKNGCEDLDLCKRLEKYNYEMGQSLDSFVFHFGGVSRGAYQNEDNKKYNKEDKYNQAYLKAKYGKETIVIYSGPSWERWSFENVEKGGIGGSEIWQISLAREFNKLGYRVISFCDTPVKEMWDGDIQYIHYSHFPEYVDQNYYDYFISSRTTDTLKYPVRVSKVYVMIHDIFLLSDKSQIFLDKVDKYCVLSEWHRDFASDYHKIPKNKMAVTANGIYFDRFDNKGIEWYPYRMFWSSSLDRGLDTLLYLFDFIKKEIPELELHVYYGMHNWETSAKQKNDATALKKIEEIKEGMKKPGVFYHGRVDQEELAKAQLSSSLWAYPSDFEESFCCHPSTSILTNQGEKQIDEIKPGDIVVSHKGRMKRINKVFERNINEVMVEFKITSLKDPLKITKNHQLLALKRDTVLCQKRDSKNVKYPAVCSKRGTQCFYQGNSYLVKGSCDKFFQPYKVKWIRAENLKKGDFVLYPRNKNKDKPRYLSDYLSHIENYIIRDSFIFRRYLKRSSLYTKSKIRNFKITKKFLEVCGWYVAEGCSGKMVRFVLNKHETKEIEFIKGVFNKFDKYVNISDNIVDNSKIITICSLTLSEFFSFNFGSHAKIKKIPQWVKDLDPVYLRYFLRGLLQGDGCLNRERSVFASSSSSLIIDLFDVFVKFGCVPSMWDYYNNGIVNIRKKGKHVLKPDINKKHPMSRIDCLVHQNEGLSSFLGYKFNISRNKFRYLLDNDYVYLRISDKKDFKYKGPVYNFEVEEDNSYIANNVIVHNCITAIEAQRAGCAVVASNYAGLKTTLGDSAILIGNGTKGQSYTKAYREKFVEECVSVLKDKDKREHWIEKGFKNTERFSWQQAALNWQKLFKE